MNSYCIYFDALNFTNPDMKDLGKISEALVIGANCSPNFDFSASARTVGGSSGTIWDVVGHARFDLPFSLSNLGLSPGVVLGTKDGLIKGVEACYDTRFRDVKEFLDKPYAMAGRVVGFFILKEGIVDQENPDELLYKSYEGDYQKDLDNYIEYNFSNGLIFVMGIVNSSLTESYKPLGIVDGVPPKGMFGVKFFEPADLLRARAQATISAQMSGGSVENNRLRLTQGSAGTRVITSGLTAKII